MKTMHPNHTTAALERLWHLAARPVIAAEGRLAGSARRLRRDKIRYLGTALVAVTVLVAGCGGSGNASPSTTPGAGLQGSSQQSGVAFASCMRAHGVSNFPDNAISVTSQGVMLRITPGLDPNTPQFRSAAQSCQQYLPKTASGGTSASSGASTQAVLNFARCMRSHGVKNFPEPDSQGHVLVQGGGDLNPNSPQFQSAMQACRHLLPANAVGAP